MEAGGFACKQSLSSKILILLGFLLGSFAFSAASVSAATITVCPNPPGGCDYTEIQTAINNANDGDVIEVQSGNYQEQVVINKNLDLIGINKPVIKAPDSPNIYQIPESSKKWEPVLFAFGGNIMGGSGTPSDPYIIEGSDKISVNVEGIVIDGNDRTPTADRSAGMLFRNVDSVEGIEIGSIKNNVVENMGFNGKQTFGIVVYGDSNVSIHDNNVSDYGRGGIGVNGDLGELPDPHAVIQNNIVNGPGKNNPKTWAPNGIQIGAGATGKILGNIVSENGWPGEGWAGSGIIVAGSDGVVVDGNTVFNNDLGISSIGWDAFGFTGFYTDHFIITNNEIYSNSYGISLQDSTKNVQIKGNNIHDNDVSGVDVAFFNMGDMPENVEVRYNNIIDNGVTGLDTYSASGNLPGIMAIINWWGDVSGPNDPQDVEASIEVDGPADCTDTPENEVNVDGAGDSIDDRFGVVDYCPWLGAPFSEDSFASEDLSAGESLISQDGNVEVTSIGGSGTAEIVQYEGNPGVGSAVFSSDSKFYDVKFLNSDATSIEIEFCNVGGNKIFWYDKNNGVWRLASNQVVQNGCILVTINSGTIPNLVQIANDLPFGGGTPAQVPAMSYYALFILFASIMSLGLWRIAK